MPKPHPIDAGDLLLRLRGELGSRHELYRAFHLAAVRYDTRRLMALVDRLDDQAEPVRTAVRRAVLDWLFRGERPGGLAELPAASDLLQ